MQTKLLIAEWISTVINIWSCYHYHLTQPEDLKSLKSYTDNSKTLAYSIATKYRPSWTLLQLNIPMKKGYIQSPINIFPIGKSPNFKG